MSLWLFLVAGGKGILFSILDLVYLFFVDLGEVSEGREAAVEVGDLV